MAVTFADCPSVVCVARSAHHPGEDRQTFSAVGVPEPVFVTQVRATHVIGSIHGAVSGRTSRGD